MGFRDRVTRALTGDRSDGEPGGFTPLGAGARPTQQAEAEDMSLTDPERPEQFGRATGRESRDRRPPESRAWDPPSPVTHEGAQPDLDTTAWRGPASTDTVVSEPPQRAHQDDPAVTPELLPRREDDVSSAGREGLVQVCIDVSEQVDSRMLRDELIDALNQAGVFQYDPQGERFDPARHHSVGRMSTDNPDQDGLIAATQKVGWLDNGARSRFPDVVVWRLDNQGQGAR